MKSLKLFIAAATFIAASTIVGCGGPQAVSFGDGSSSATSQGNGLVPEQSFPSANDIAAAQADASAKLSNAVTAASAADAKLQTATPPAAITLLVNDAKLNQVNAQDLYAKCMWAVDPISCFSSVGLAASSAVIQYQAAVSAFNINVAPQAATAADTCAADLGKPAQDALAAKAAADGAKSACDAAIARNTAYAGDVGKNGCIAQTTDKLDSALVDKLQQATANWSLGYDQYRKAYMEFNQQYVRPGTAQTAAQCASRKALILAAIADFNSSVAPFGAAAAVYGTIPWATLYPGCPAH